MNHGLEGKMVKSDYMGTGGFNARQFSNQTIPPYLLQFQSHASFTPMRSILFCSFVSYWPSGPYCFFGISYPPMEKELPFYDYHEIFMI
jgi:hypothetical protein